MQKLKSPPKCRECGSTDIRATSSEQFRRINGQLRRVADAVCNHCGHSWWSVSKAVRAMARQLDEARKA